MKECVLVAGGAGYIGTHTAVELIEAGYDVVIVDNLSNSEIKAVEGVREITGRNVPFERVDCDDRQALAGVFDRYRFGAVIHFAASKAVGESVEKPLLYYRNNILSLLNVLDLMREKEIFIFRHDYIPSKNRLSQILSQVKKFVQHSNGIFAICNSPLLH